MYRNKHGFFKRLQYRLYRIVPATRRIKQLFQPFKVSSFAKRLEGWRRRVAESREKTGRSPLFDHVEIETLNRCNGECAFCPVNRHQDPRTPARMPDELFNRIIDELRELDYRGEVCLFSNNESLLDKRIVAFTESARQALPKAKLVLSTNGTLLTPELYRSLVDNLDLFYVNNYCEDFQLRPGVAEIMELAKTRPEWWEKTHIVVRYQGEIMSSRGGLAPNKIDIRPAATLPVGCSYLASQLIIRPDGKLSLCCNDALGKVTLGDVSGQGLAEAWFSPSYEEARTRVLAGRDAFELCRHCDTLGD